MDEAIKYFFAYVVETTIERNDPRVVDLFFDEFFDHRIRFNFNSNNLDHLDIDITITVNATEGDKNALDHLIEFLRDINSYREYGKRKIVTASITKAFSKKVYPYS